MANSEERQQITESWMLEEAPGGHLVEPSAQSRPSRLLRKLIQSSFIFLQRWRFHHLSKQPVPISDHPHDKSISPIIQSKISVFQFKFIDSYPNHCTLLRRACLLFSLVVGGSNKLSLSLSLYVTCSSPLIVLVIIWWTPSNTSMYFLHWVAQN